MQQLARMDFPQAVQGEGEDAANEVLAKLPALDRQMLLERLAAFVLHDQIDGLVRAKEVHDPNHIRVR